MGTKSANILVLGGTGKSTNIVCNYLAERYKDVFLIQEKPESKTKFFKRRISKLGYWNVFGQLLFMAIVSPILTITSLKRIKEIGIVNNFNSHELNRNSVVTVDSINDKEVLDKIKRIKPNIIIVNGTRIIGKRLLESLTCKCINTHVGITPKYRGVHGGYWALFNNEPELCGVTVHLVDAGIDTGKVLNQSLINVTRKDNFSTYPLLQLAKGLELLPKTIDDVLSDKVLEQNALTSDSQLWYHPTIWSYVYSRIVHRIK